MEGSCRLQEIVSLHTCLSSASLALRLDGIILSLPAVGAIVGLKKIEIRAAVFTAFLLNSLDYSELFGFRCAYTKNDAAKRREVIFQLTGFLVEITQQAVMYQTGFFLILPVARLDMQRRIITVPIAFSPAFRAVPQMTSARAPIPLVVRVPRSVQLWLRYMPHGPEKINFRGLVAILHIKKSSLSEFHFSG